MVNKYGTQWCHFAIIFPYHFKRVVWIQGWFNRNILLCSNPSFPKLVQSHEIFDHLVQIQLWFLILYLSVLRTFIFIGNFCKGFTAVGNHSNYFEQYKLFSLSANILGLKGKRKLIWWNDGFYPFQDCGPKWTLIRTHTMVMILEATQLPIYSLMIVLISCFLSMTWVLGAHVPVELLFAKMGTSMWRLYKKCSCLICNAILHHGCVKKKQGKLQLHSAQCLVCHPHMEEPLPTKDAFVSCSALIPVTHMWQKHSLMHEHNTT